MAERPDRGWIGRALAGGALRAVAFMAVKFVLPFLGALMTFFAGYFSDIPWMWVFMATCVSFGATAGGLLWFDDWLSRRRVEGKLTFTQALIARDIKGNGVVIGVRVGSTASFPLEFEISEIRTRLGTTVPHAAHSSKKFEVPAGGYGWYYDHVIAVPNPPKPGALEGFLEYKVHYGRQGSDLPYRLSGKKQVIAQFNGQGMYEGGIWQEAN